MRFLSAAWSDLGGDPALLERIEAAAQVPLRSRTEVGELAGDSVALASLALSALGARRAGRELCESVRVDPDRTAASFASDRYFRLDGQAVAGFAPLSGFWATSDGWVRTHANYPHHEARLRQVLGLSSDADRSVVETAIASERSDALEERATAAGAVATAVRSADEWRALPVARHLGAQPLIRTTSLDRRAVAPRTWRVADRPLSGVRVLDLTRVIAGPVATRALALAGADVLRVDTPHLPEIAWQHLDTGQGKHSTLLDLRNAGQLATLRRLLAAADVLVTGYRPDALAEFGLDDAVLAADHPGLVVGRVNAWGSGGPWAHRRGFDSIVQAATGVADLERSLDGRPGALPAQALDHASGYLLAAGIAQALSARLDGSAGATVEVALARVGMALLQTATTAAAEVAAVPLPGVDVQNGTGPLGTVSCAPPALAFPSAPRAWDRVGAAWGVDRPVWIDLRSI